MSKLLAKLFVILLALYVLSVLVIWPFFNWRYIQNNGVRRWLAWGGAVVTLKSVVWPYYVFLEQGTRESSDTTVRVLEYTDHEYAYAFQYPSNWRMMKPPDASEVGEVRVLLQGPGGTAAMVAVGHLGRNLSREQYETAPNKAVVVDQLIDLTIDQVYRKTSRDLKATRMIVSERRRLPSEVGIKFYISTLNTLETGIPVVVVGIHYVPFAQDYGIAFLMTTVFDQSAKVENETFKNAFNSFHLLAERLPAGR